MLSKIGAEQTMDRLVAAIVAKGGTDSAVLTRFLSSVYGQDGYLTPAAQQAEQAGQVNFFVANALQAAQKSAPSVDSSLPTQPNEASCSVMSALMSGASYSPAAAAAA